MEYLGLLIIGIIIGFVIFWFKNRVNQSTADNLVKLKENLINQLKSENPEEYNKMSFAQNPYGDGNASKKIMNAFMSYKG